MWIRHSDLNLPDTTEGQEKQTKVNEAFNIMVLEWCCGLPVILISIYILVRAWRVNLDCVKILCVFMILSQACNCASRSTYL